jgi:hypothetical protein
MAAGTGRVRRRRRRPSVRAGEAAQTDGNALNRGAAAIFRCSGGWRWGVRTVDGACRSGTGGADRVAGPCDGLHGLGDAMAKTAKKDKKDKKSKAKKKK